MYPKSRRIDVSYSVWKLEKVRATRGGGLGSCGLVGRKILMVAIDQRQGFHSHGEDVSM